MQKRQRRGMWPLTKKECRGKKVPHMLQRLVPERGGTTQLCELCGTIISRATPKRRAA